MLIFDRIRLQDLDRRNWQLWILAIVMIVVLAGGLALHMYTLATAPGLSLSRGAMLEGIISFCVLALLFVGYLIDRQMVIDHLRKELGEERNLNLERRMKGNKELIQTLVGPGQFCDHLAMELQHATNRRRSLAGLTISLEVSPDLSDVDDVYSTFGAAVKAMMGKLRAEDSIYQFTPGVFGILLPGAGPDMARGVAVRVADGLNEAMGYSKRYSFEIHITNYPDQAKTAPEMERMMRAPRDR
jgi:predicted signal transduction protein with EAL and GGDEF domain